MLLLVLVVSYRQVIAVHPNGGGAYAVAKKDLGRTVSLLAAASLVVDYVLTVAVSLAAGAASLGSVFPVMAHHLLGVTLAGLALITAINLIGIAESAKVLMGADATESCTTNEVRCSPQQFAHAPTLSSPRFRFAWTEHPSPPIPKTGAFPPGFRTVRQSATC